MIKRLKNIIKQNIIIYLLCLTFANIVNAQWYWEKDPEPVLPHFATSYPENRDLNINVLTDILGLTPNTTAYTFYEISVYEKYDEEKHKQINPYIGKITLTRDKAEDTYKVQQEFTESVLKEHPRIKKLEKDLRRKEAVDFVITPIPEINPMNIKEELNGYVQIIDTPYIIPAIEKYLTLQGYEYKTKYFYITKKEHEIKKETGNIPKQRKIFY